MSIRFLAWVGMLAFAHPIMAQTSLEEYLYVTYGYKEQLQKGLDDKKGYSWKPLLQHKFSYKKSGFLNGQYQIGVFEFEGLYRGDESKPCALAAVFREREGLTKKDGVFICILHPKTEKDIQDKAEKYLLEEAKLAPSVFEQYSIGLGKLSMKIATM